MKAKDIRKIFKKCKKDFIKEIHNPDISEVLEGVSLSAEEIKDLEKTVKKYSFPGSPSFEQCLRVACEAYLLAYCKKDEISIYTPS
jgi:hypothetical protein